VNGVAFSSDGKKLAAAGVDRTVRVWDVTTGRKIHCLRGYPGPVAAVAFSPDGTHLATAYWDKVMVWELAPAGGKGPVPRTFPGSQGWVRAVAFSWDGRLASAAAGGQIPGKQLQPGEVKVWDLTTGQAVLTLSMFNTYADAVAFSPDGARLAVASYLAIHV